MSRPRPPGVTHDHAAVPRVVTSPKRPLAIDVDRRPGEPEPTGREDGCRFIYGPPTERLFCGAAVIRTGSSWCHFHLRQVFNGVADGTITDADLKKIRLTGERE